MPMVYPILDVWGYISLYDNTLCRVRTFSLGRRMTAVEQEKYFLKLRAAHPGWTSEFTSGYVHGVQDEAERPTPQQVYSRSRSISRDGYRRGYLFGFIMHRGSDVEMARWFGRLVQS